MCSSAVLISRKRMWRLVGLGLVCAAVLFASTNSMAEPKNAPLSLLRKGLAQEFPQAGHFRVKALKDGTGTRLQKVLRMLRRGRKRPNVQAWPLGKECAFSAEEAGWHKHPDAAQAYQNTLSACREATAKSGNRRLLFGFRWATDDDDFIEEGIGFVLLDTATSRMLLVEFGWMWFER